MRVGLTLLAFPLALAIPIACGAQSDSTQNAQVAAQTWLALTDSGQYSTSWDNAASLFKIAVTRDGWQNALGAVRSPLGALRSRKLKSATFTRTLPGAPDGEYVVILYETQFENKASAVETVTPMHESDGSWRVSGYFIR